MTPPTVVAMIATAKIQTPHDCHHRRRLTSSQKVSLTDAHPSRACKADLT
jgi:hypothetical protein